MKLYRRLFKESNDIWKNIRDKYTKLNIDVSIYQGNYVSILSKIEIPKELRNKGYAKNIMMEICDIADDNNIILALTPTNEFGSSKSRLIDFYKNFGFVLNKGKNKNYRTSETMLRLPKYENL